MVSEDNSLTALFALVYRARVGAAVAFCVGLAITFAVAFLSRPVYRSQVVAVVSAGGDEAGLSSILGQFGGLASLAGVNLPSRGGIGPNEAIAVLSSAEFTRRFIERENLLPLLFEDEWDAAAEKWKEADSEDAPTMGDGVKKFIEQVRRVQLDEVTGIITVSVEWYDRELAAAWANQLVRNVNEELRARAISEATRSIQYLEAEAQKTSVTEVRDAIYGLVETQVKTIMLANVRDEYAFRVLDPGVVSDNDKFVWPRPALVLGLGLIFSTLLAIAWPLTVAVFRKLRLDYSESLKLR